MLSLHTSQVALNQADTYLRILSSMKRLGHFSVVTQRQVTWRHVASRDDPNNGCEGD